MGSRHQDEDFGDDFELPPDRAYAETCAAIASTQLAWRLLLDTGGAEYADLIERTLLNAVLVGLRPDGRAFFYSNTLQQRVRGSVPDEDALSSRAESSLRAPWFEVSCCPTNIARTLASVQLLFATRTDRGIQLHQYGDYSVATRLGQGRVALDVRSDSPVDGRVTVTITEAPAEPIAIRLRVPAWAEGAVLADGDRRIEAHGRAVEVERVFVPGDRLVLDIPFPLRMSVPDARIDALRGQVAVERGPLVLCLESTDLPDGLDVQDVGGVRAVRWDGERALAELEIEEPAEDEWPYGEQPKKPHHRTLTAGLVPYATWANRGPSTMRVFLPASAAP